MEEKIILEVDFNSEEAQKRIVVLQTEIRKQKVELKQLDEAYKAGLISEQKYSEEQVKLQAVLKGFTTEQKELIKGIELETSVIESNNGSRKQLVATLALAQKQLNETGGLLIQNADGTIELTDAYVEASDAVEKARKALLQFDEGINDGRTNVGRYKAAITDSLNEFKLYGISAENLSDIFSGGLKGAVGTAQASFDTLKTTLLANPIFIIAAALAGIVAAFASTEAGANKINQIFARLKPILDAVLTPVYALGEAFINLIDYGTKLGALFSDSFFGTSLEDGAKLEKQLQEINKKQITLDSQNKITLANAERLKSIRDDESKSFAERIAKNKELGDILIKNNKAQLDNAKNELKVSEEIFKRLPAREQSSEKLRELEEKRAAVAEKEGEFFGLITEQITNQVSLLKESLDVQNQIQGSLLEQDILRGKIQEGSAQEISERKKLIDAQLDNSLLALDRENKLAGKSRDEKLKILRETNENAKLLIINSENEKLSLDKDFRQKQAENYEAYISKINETNEAQKEKQKADLALQLSEQSAYFARLVLLQEEGSKEQLQARINSLVASATEEIKTSELKGEQLKLRQQQLNAEILALQVSFNEQKKTIDAENEERDKQIQQGLADEELLFLENNLTETNRIIREKEAEIDAQSLEGEAQKNLAKLELRQQFAETLRSQEEQLLTEQLEFELEFQAFSDEEKRAARQRYLDGLLELETRYTQSKGEIEKLRNDQERQNLETTEGLLGQAASLFEENTAAFKILASAQALVSTYLGASKALAEVPFPANIIAATLTTIQGLLSVAKINGVQFADGGLLEMYGKGGAIKGAGTGKSDSILARVSNGEAILNAASMSANDNISVSGTPRQIASSINSMYGGKAFADGGLMSLNEGVLGLGIQNLPNDSVANETINSFSSMKIYTSITEINEVNRKVTVTENNANV